ncbi:MAG TPA: YdeI/OmpD-associated family protein [Saprospiraceae bacterium]|nr:YdeI/OmpD-associated family protein [Saprospiraceae bacterium]
MDIIFFDKQSDLRNWLLENHKRASELWIGFHKIKSKLNSITYKEALDEVLSFGWIDGIRKSIDQESYKIRFTPRTTNSIWSQVNINRLNELTRLGLMHSSGTEVYKNRNLKMVQRYSFEQDKIELSTEHEKLFKENSKAWEFFQNQVPSYKKPAMWWILSAKQASTQLKRLSILVEYSGKEERIPALKRP